MFPYVNSSPLLLSVTGLRNHAGFIGLEDSDGVSLD